MRKKCVFFLLLFAINPVFSQDGFVFDKGVEKSTVPIKLINNLVFIPIKINGVELNFLLDTGVEETILFSLDDSQEISFYNSEKITLRGLGSEADIEGLKTTNNLLEINGMKAANQLVYVILDQTFNLSSQIGIPVNGIIGYEFFRNNLVEINYGRKRVNVYADNQSIIKKLDKKYTKVPITIERYKPYVLGEVLIDEVRCPVKLLIDCGNSDSVWLFQKVSDITKVPAKHFDDFLGKGFSGDIEGKRAKISQFSLEKFNFNTPIVGFPDSTSIKNVKMVQDRVGSVGGEILKRFAVVFDYTNEKLYLKKNGEFSNPFSYNKSGVEIKQNGLQWVHETVKLETVPLFSAGITYDSKGDKVTDNFKYKFMLKPIYEISNVRKNSPAAICGLQVGDFIIKINSHPVYRYSLQKINEMFKSEDDMWITLDVKRKDQMLKFIFQIKDIL